ncbi:MAG: multicopper oxidase domain-containing protein [bacterium]|nr:multicopper oxidase domain-containing protein [bacterium]
MYSYLFLNLIGIIGAIVASLLILKGLFHIRKHAENGVRRLIDTGVGLFIVAGCILIFSSGTYPVHFALPPMMQAMTSDQKPASLPLLASIEFLFNQHNFELIDDIGLDPSAVGEPIGEREPETVELTIHAKEVISEIGDNINFNYWTYDGTVPGPFLRVREGDTVQLSLSNDETSLHPHNIDLHAVTGPGGGAAVTLVEPGETRTVKCM